MLFSTFMGREIDLNNFRHSDVDIRDIAHGLSFMCRFNGQCRDFYSVAQHSLRVSQLLHGKDALAGLLHDAAEAYLCDMTRPAKKYFPKYIEMEQRIQGIILERFDLPRELPQAVKTADSMLLYHELAEQFPRSKRKHPLVIHPNCLPKPCPMYEAERTFLRTFFKLREKQHEGRTNTQSNQCRA